MKNINNKVTAAKKENEETFEIMKGEFYYHTQNGHLYIVQQTHSGDYALVSLVNGSVYIKEVSNADNIFGASNYFVHIKPGTKITIKVKKPKE